MNGFGISIASKDVDDNHYPDLLIGSYLSNKAILLRTRPLATVKPEIILNIEQINVKNKDCKAPNGRPTVCFDIYYCIQYDGNYVPLKQQFDVNLKIDSEKIAPRCYVQIGNKRLDSINQKITVELSKGIQCSDKFRVYLHVSFLIELIQINLDFFLLGKKFF